jgi:ATP adenylyltransferase
MSEPCPFCHPDPAWVFHEGEGVVALWDAFPASPGHALVVPRRHVAGWFDATRAEQRELLEAVDVARARIEASHAPDGYNIGVNVGAAAGQTVFQAGSPAPPGRTGRRTPVSVHGSTRYLR